MQLTGHETSNIYDRYSISSKGNLEEAIKRVVAYEGESAEGILPIEREA